MLLKGLGAAGVGVAVAGAGSTVAHAGTTSAPATPTGEITAAGVARGLKALVGIIDRDMGFTTVPGTAVAVVYDGKIVFSQGFGKRQIGKKRDNTVTADTVFQLASVSKPISSTVIAAALSKPAAFAKVAWNDTVQAFRPSFTLADAYVGSHVTVGDMFAHRSGLPDHAGDLLEDLGFSEEYVIAKLAGYPLAPFRNNYDYTNFGLTVGAEAIAAATGRSWQALASQLVFQPLGMSSTSFAFADLQSRSNRAALHKLVKGEWVANLSDDNDRQAPAGGASSSVNDLAKWMKMLLAEGSPITDTAQLQQIWRPQNVRPGLPPIGGRAQFYGYGWNVSYEDTGELAVGHSGAFGQGAATAINLLPSEKLAIVSLTNGPPIGLPESINAEFFDFVRYGKSSRNWLEFVKPYFVEAPTADQLKYSQPPVKPTPARGLSAYVGTYPNPIYGDHTVSLHGGALFFTAGPDQQQFALVHYSGDDFYFVTTGENETGYSGAIFAGGSPTRATSVTINAWNRDKLATFTRK
jgi:CubicO group peptidase (beta-lactamase class C family)